MWDKGPEHGKEFAFENQEGRPKGRRCLTTLLAVASHKFDLDPGSTIPASIVGDLAARLWRGDLSIERLTPVWSHVKSNIVAGKLRASFIRGPVSAAVHAAGMAGWRGSLEEEELEVG